MSQRESYGVTQGPSQGASQRASRGDTPTRAPVLASAQFSAQAVTLPLPTSITQRGAPSDAGRTARHATSASSMVDTQTRELSASNGSAPHSHAHLTLPAVNHEEIHAAARQESFIAGLEQGRQEGMQACMQAIQQETDAARSSWAQRLESLQHMLKTLHTETTAIQAAAEDDLVALVFELVCRMVGEQAVTREGVHGMVDAALAQLTHARALAVHLAPADLNALRAEPTWQSIEQSAETNHVQWVADPSVHSGCRIVTSQGALDARLTTMLELVRQQLLVTRRTRLSNGERDTCRV